MFGHQTKCLCVISGLLAYYSVGSKKNWRTFLRLQSDLFIKSLVWRETLANLLREKLTDFRPWWKFWLIWLTKPCFLWLITLGHKYLFIFSSLEHQGWALQCMGRNLPNLLFAPRGGSTLSCTFSFAKSFQSCKIGAITKHHSLKSAPFNCFVNLQSFV